MLKDIESQTTSVPMIVKNSIEYEKKAIAIATNKIYLKDLKCRLNQKRIHSTLFDTKTQNYANNLISLENDTTGIVEYPENNLDKGNFKHFMQKEIFEQPHIIGDSLSRFLDPVNKIINIPDIKINWKIDLNK